MSDTARGCRYGDGESNSALIHGRAELCNGHTCATLGRPVGRWEANREFVLAIFFSLPLLPVHYLPSPFPLTLLSLRSRVSSIRGDTRDIFGVFGVFLYVHTSLYAREAHRRPPYGGLPNDAERIGKVDRLKSIMLGDYREEPQPWSPADSISLERPRYPRFLGRSLIRTSRKSRLNMYLETGGSWSISLRDFMVSIEQVFRSQLKRLARYSDSTLRKKDVAMAIV